MNENNYTVSVERHELYRYTENFATHPRIHTTANEKLVEVLGSGIFSFERVNFVAFGYD